MRPDLRGMWFDFLFHTLLALVMGGLAWALPARGADSVYARLPFTAAELQKLNARGTPVLLLALFAWIGIFTYAFALCFEMLVGATATWGNSAVYRITPGAVWGGLPGGLLAFAWARKPVEWVVRLVHGQHVVDAMNANSERTYGYDVEAGWYWLRRVFTVLGMVAFIWCSDVALHVYSDHLELNRASSLFTTEKIPLADVKQVCYAHGFLLDNGRVAPDPAYLLRFSNGAEWRSTDFKLSSVEQPLRYLAQQAHLRIDTVEVWR
jgi:hypothetical protein